jgi:hypothetical protein
MEFKPLPSKLIIKTLFISFKDYSKLEEKMDKFINYRSTCPCPEDNCQDMMVQFRFYLIQNEIGMWILNKAMYSDEQYNIIKNLYGTS